MAQNKGIGQYFELRFLTSDLILKNLPFIAFLGFLAIIYIANVHYAQRNIRQIQEVQKEIKDMRWKYMSLQSENMYNRKQAEVVERVKEEGLQLHRGKPKKIVIKK